MMSRAFTCLICLLAVLLGCGAGERGKPVLRLAVTTSVRDSGLLGAVLPAFAGAGERRVEVSAVGSGHALELLRSGAADVAITHSPADEARALDEGGAAARTPFMRNTYVLVGPAEHAGVVAGAVDIRGAMRRIADSGHKFISRADGSGTHERERQLWQDIGVAPDSRFIRPVRGGMAQALELADREHAFTLSDRATFLARRGDLGLAILFQSDAELDNTYAVLEPAPRPGVDPDGARAFVEFLRSDTGRSLIGSFGVDTFGEPLFAPVQ
jgi:tungstate transport system substrate-binding protein